MLRDALHNLIKFGIKTAFEVEPLNDPIEAQRRLSICKSNAGICYDSDKDKCKECGCYMSIKTEMAKHMTPKGYVQITHCPLAKWDKLEHEIINKYKTLNYGY